MNSYTPEVKKKLRTSFGGRPANGGRTVYKSRLAWFQHYGEWPTLEIDHKDRNPLNNEISNLRLATRCQQLWNTSRRIDNTSGERGVSCNITNKRWEIKVNAGPVKVHFAASHKISAILAARLIRRTLHGEFAYQEAAL